MGTFVGTSRDDDYTGHRPFIPIGDGACNGEDAPASADETKRATYIIGPNGNIVTIADLPPPRVTRWVIRRKAEVVLAVHAGLLSREEACKRYGLTLEEFRSWQIAIERHGLLGLRITQLQQYRNGGRN